MFRYSAKYLHTWCLIQGSKFWSYYNSSHFITKEFPAIFTQPSGGTYIILQLNSLRNLVFFGEWLAEAGFKFRSPDSIWFYWERRGGEYSLNASVCQAWRKKFVMHCLSSHQEDVAFPPYRWGDWDSERGSHWKKVTQVGTELGLIASHSIL